MSQELAMFDQAQVPAYLQNDAFDGGEGNLDSTTKVNSLSIRGKVFRITVDGDEKPLLRVNKETGDKEPISVFGAVVLNQGPFGARVLYDKKYSADSNDGPKCFSLDGKYPDKNASEPQAPTCAQCPHAVKGSKVTPSGTLSTACSLQRRLAVIPGGKMDFAALLLRLAATSAYDPDTKNAEDGWMGWRQYLDFLHARGVRHTAQLVTKIKFDPEAEHPKLLFSAARWLTEEEAKIVAERIKSDEVNEMLFAPEDAGPARLEVPTEAAEEEDGEDWDEETAEEEDGEDWEEEEEAPPPPPKKVAKKKVTKKKVTKKKAASDEDDTSVKRKTVGKAKGESGGSKDIDNLLDDWDA